MLHQPVTVTKIKARRIFRMAGEITHEFIVVKKGVLATFRELTGHEGRRIVALTYPGEGILPGRFIATGLIALTDAEISLPPSPHHAEALGIARYNERIMQEWLARDSLDAVARLAHALCEHIERGRHHVREVPLFTQAAFGQIAGMTSVHTNRVLADMERGGLIRRPKAHMMEVLNHDELARLGSFKPDYLR